MEAVRIGEVLPVVLAGLLDRINQAEELERCPVPAVAVLDDTIKRREVRVPVVIVGESRCCYTVRCVSEVSVLPGFTLGDVRRVSRRRVMEVEL